MDSKIESKVLDWMARGNTGLSSKCMAAHLTGRENDKSHPHDASDFLRCVVLLVSVPELREHLPKMADVSDYWAALVPRWDEIEAFVIDEKRAEATTLMRSILDPIMDNDPKVVRLGPGAFMSFS